MTASISPGAHVLVVVDDIGRARSAVNHRFARPRRGRRWRGGVRLRGALLHRQLDRPTSLGVNPSLTISALSEGAAQRLIASAGDLGLPARPAHCSRGFLPSMWETASFRQRRLHSRPAASGLRRATTGPPSHDQAQALVTPSAWRGGRTVLDGEPTLDVKLPGVARRAWLASGAR